MTIKKIKDSLETLLRHLDKIDDWLLSFFDKRAQREEEEQNRLAQLEEDRIKQYEEYVERISNAQQFYLYLFGLILRGDIQTISEAIHRRTDYLQEKIARKERANDEDVVAELDSGGSESESHDDTTVGEEERQDETDREDVAEEDDDEEESTDEDLSGDLGDLFEDEDDDTDDVIENDSVLSYTKTKIVTLIFLTIPSAMHVPPYERYWSKPEREAQRVAESRLSNLHIMIPMYIGARVYDNEPHVFIHGLSVFAFQVEDPLQHDEELVLTKFGEILRISNSIISAIDDTTRKGVELPREIKRRFRTIRIHPDMAEHIYHNLIMMAGVTCAIPSLLPPENLTESNDKREVLCCENVIEGAFDGNETKILDALNNAKTLAKNRM